MIENLMESTNICLNQPVRAIIAFLYEKALRGVQIYLAINISLTKQGTIF